MIVRNLVSYNLRISRMRWLILVAIFGVGSSTNGEDVDIGISDSYGLTDDGFSWLREVTDEHNDKEYKIPGFINEKYGSYNEEEQKRLDEIFGYTGPTANDEPENLIRPCALDDWQCIRKYFAANSPCTPAYGPIPDPLKLDMVTLFFPSVNTTFTLPNSQVRGLSSAKVKEFYINKKSGNLVFAIDVQNLNQTIPRGYIRYRRTAKESIILADYITINFKSTTFTAVIPKVPNLRLDLADIHADVEDGTPVFFIGPGATKSTDLDVITATAQLITLLPFAVREGFLFLSQLFTSIYIQSNICDFGLKLISV